MNETAFLLSVVMQHGHGDKEKREGGTDLHAKMEPEVKQKVATRNTSGRIVIVVEPGPRGNDTQQCGRRAAYMACGRASREGLLTRDVLDGNVVCRR